MQIMQPEESVRNFKRNAQGKEVCFLKFNFWVS